MQFRELTDRYQLEKILKSTRFGTVLRAADSKSGRTVVIKQITVPSPPRLVAGAPEFQKLAGTLAGMSHPALPAVLDSGFTTDGAAFLTLELLEGKGLDALAGAAPARTLARIGLALEGLEALAAQGLAHRNLSPDNLFVVDTPGGEQVKLLGLGTAVFRPAGAEAAGATVPENARFQAPELAAGGPVDSRADLYSLALVTCQALGATVGFGDGPVVQLPLAVSFELENDEALRQALERSLRQNPAERPSFRGFREALRLAAGGAMPAAPEIQPPAPAPSFRTPPPAPVVPEPLSIPAATVMPFTPPPASPAPSPAVQASAPLVIPDAWAPSGPPATGSPGGAALSSAAAPQFTEPDPLPPLDGTPAEPGEMLTAVDDEILNALLAVPPPSPRPAAPAPDSGKVVPFLRKAAKPPAPAPTPATGAVPARPAARPLLRRPAVLGGAALALALLLAAGFWLFRSQTSEPVVVQAPATDLDLPKPFSRPPVDKLEEAKLYLAEGDDAKARRLLRSIPWGEQGLLSPGGCRTLSALQENLALAAVARMPADLSEGLKTGDLELLETAVESGTGQEATLAPDVRASYDKARGILDAYAQARTASARGNFPEALARFATAASLLPKMNDPDDLRGKAAAALEAQADALARDGKYAEGRAKLEPIQRTWPDRPGFKERLARFEKYQQDEQQQESILAALPNIERHKKPWDGLQMMNGVTPTPHLAQQFQEARARLEDMLARLDKEPPKVALRDGYALDYDRGTVANLSFRVSDDYQIKEVKLMARPEGGRFRDLPLDQARAGYYTVEVQPSFHQNGTVDFYVVATDLSGHEGYLGSRDQPLHLKRKQGFERMIR